MASPQGRSLKTFCFSMSRLRKYVRIGKVPAFLSCDFDEVGGPCDVVVDKTVGACFIDTA